MNKMTKNRPSGREMYLDFGDATIGCMRSSAVALNDSAGRCHRQLATGVGHASTRTPCMSHLLELHDVDLIRIILGLFDVCSCGRVQGTVVCQEEETRAQEPVRCTRRILRSGHHAHGDMHA